MNDIQEIARELLLICPHLSYQIAACAEQAYRRGYQQGALYGAGLDEEIVDWRFSDPSCYESSVAPPDTRGRQFGYSCSALERLSMEAGNASALIAVLVMQTKRQYRRQ